MTKIPTIQGVPLKGQNDMSLAKLVEMFNKPGLVLSSAIAKNNDVRQIIGGILSADYKFRNITLLKDSEIQFHLDENKNYFSEKIKSGKIAEDLVVAGNIICARNSNVEFDFSGRVVSCERLTSDISVGSVVIKSEAKVNFNYNDKGQLKISGFLAKIVTFEMTIEGTLWDSTKEVTCHVGYKVALDEKGNIESCHPKVSSLN